MTRSLRLSILLALCIAAHGASGQGQRHGQAQRIKSPDHRVALLELFTSEGCSSCPRADRWLRDLEDDHRLWSQVVPVAFHVDYWDSIGWPDRFARAEFSARQREYARAGNVGSVYTPGFVVDGREWRGWFRRPDLSLDHASAPGILILDVDETDVDARYTPAGTTPGALELNLAVLGFDLRTRVQGGENEGRVLEHDFVVLGYERVPMRGTEAAFAVSTRMPPVELPAPRRALAAWVSRAGDQAPIQAAGGWLR